MIDNDEEARGREKLAYDRHKERERERRIARANPEKRLEECYKLLLRLSVINCDRSKLERDKDRDISEKIALGLPSGAPSQESLFDQRLFNQTQVMLVIMIMCVYNYCVSECGVLFIPIAHFNNSK